MRSPVAALIAPICLAACITGTAQNEDGPPRDASDKDGPVVDALPDAPPSELIFKDLQPPNDLPPPLPDLCPGKLVACSGICVDLQTSFQHCGSCDNGCLASTTDSCKAGKCVCGANDGPCDGSRNCSGGQCVCQPGGLCDGCCDGDTCVVLTEVNRDKCGFGGAACGICDDSDPCTQDLCGPAGVCDHPPVPDSPLVQCATGVGALGACCAGSCCQGACCGPVCCPAWTTCCNAGTGLCCAADQICAGVSCDPISP